MGHFYKTWDSLKFSNISDHNDSTIDYKSLKITYSIISYSNPFDFLWPSLSKDRVIEVVIIYSKFTDISGLRTIFLITCWTRLISIYFKAFKLSLKISPIN